MRICVYKIVILVKRPTFKTRSTDVCVSLSGLWYWRWVYVCNVAYTGNEEYICFYDWVDQQRESMYTELSIFTCLWIASEVSYVSEFFYGCCDKACIKTTFKIFKQAKTVNILIIKSKSIELQMSNDKIHYNC